jgi:hypothetical protein
VLHGGGIFVELGPCGFVDIIVMLENYVAVEIFCAVGKNCSHTKHRPEASMLGGLARAKL